MNFKYLQKRKNEARGDNLPSVDVDDHHLLRLLVFAIFLA